MRFRALIGIVKHLTLVSTIYTIFFIVWERVRRGSGRLFVFTRIITAVPKAHRGPLMYKKAHTLNILPTSPACIFLALFCAHFLFHSLALALSLSRSTRFLLMLCCICILARQKSVLICDVRRLNSHRTFLEDFFFPKTLISVHHFSLHNNNHNNNNNKK